MLQDLMCLLLFSLKIPATIQQRHNLAALVGRRADLWSLVNVGVPQVHRTGNGSLKPAAGVPVNKTHKGCWVWVEPAAKEENLALVAGSTRSQAAVPPQNALRHSSLLITDGVCSFHL